MVFCAPMTSSVRIIHCETCAMKSLNVRMFPLALANLVLEDTVERIYAGNTFAEKWCGLFLIRGENVVLLGEIVPPLSPSCLSLTLIIDYRIWIRKMTSHYARLITSSSMITIDRTSLQRSRGRKQRRRSCTSRKDSARKEGREMVIEKNPYESPHSGRFIKPQGKRGHSLFVKYTCRSFITRRFQECYVWCQ
jgi:hypothetical protein